MLVFLWSNKIVPIVQPPNYINNASINRVHSFRFLGVVLDVNLKFKEHVPNITKNMAKFISFIYGIRKYLNKALAVKF